MLRVETTCAVLLMLAAPACAAAETDPADGAGAPSAAESAAEAMRLFRDLYADTVAAARRSPGFDDDLEVAGRLLEAAKKAEDHGAFAAVLANEASKLAAARPEGFGTALDALAVVAEHAPASAILMAERRTDIRRRQYSLARGAEKTKVGEKFIDALTALADSHEADGDWAAAVAGLRQALGVARTIRSERTGALVARLRRAGHRQQRQALAQTLKARLRENPDDKATRERLVRVLLVDLDDPAGAAKMVAGTEDEELARYVRAAAKGVEATPELACRKMGTWYRDLAADATEPAKGPMLHRSATYYERFLELHAEDDLGRTAAKLALDEVREALAALEPEPPEAKLKPGLVGLYYHGANFGTFAFHRIDPKLDFPNMRALNFKGGRTKRLSVRWVGKLRVPKRGTYVIYSTSDDGQRVWLDGKEIISDWGPHRPNEQHARLELDAGVHDLRVEYMNIGRRGMYRLSLEGPGITKQPVPPAALLHHPDMVPETKGGERE